MATRWGSRIKMGEGPEYLCADEKEAGEREREEIQEGAGISRVRSLHRQEGMQAEVGLNYKHGTLCLLTGKRRVYDHGTLCLLTGKKGVYDHGTLCLLTGKRRVYDQKKKNRYYGMSLPKSLIIVPMSLMKHEVRSSTKSEEVVEN